MNQTNNNPLKSAPIYETDYYMPKYKSGEYGDWRISIMGLGHDHGYTSGVWMVSNVPILSRRNSKCEGGWESWMSLTPHEIESQELCVRFGFGHVVVMGLGLGWLAINTALNSRVTNVTVIEIDHSVIELFNNSGSLNGLDNTIRNKITIICGDALKWRSKNKVDFLYVDIWKSLNEKTALNEVRIMQNNLNATVIYYWGQELTLYNEIKNNDCFENEVSYENINSIVQKTFRLPLLIPQEIDYPEMIQKVADNRARRGLKV